MKTERMARPTAVALFSSLSLLSAGCGLTTSHGPPVGHEQMTSFTCTQSNIGPLYDIVWGGFGVMQALGYVFNPTGPIANSGPIVAAGFTGGAFAAASAVEGFSKSSRCRAAKRLLAERQARAMAATSTDTLRVGARHQLLATALTAGIVTPQSAFSWTSSNDTIASVTGAGLVTAHAAGSVVIRARSGDVVHTANVLVSRGAP